MRAGDVVGALMLLLLAAALALGLSAVNGWGSRLQSTVAEESRRQQLRADDRQYTEPLRARLLARSGLDRLVVELRRARQGGHPPMSPLGEILREDEGYDGVLVTFEREGDGVRAVSRGRVVRREFSTGATLVAAECTVRARIAADLTLSVASVEDTTSAPTPR